MVSIERDVECVLRDGCRLWADVYRPPGEGLFPTLVLRTPYDKRYVHHAVYAHPAWYAAQGFLVVLQDMRGRYSSDGDFVPYLNEGLDGYDTVEWAASLEGSNGQVGLYGQSYAGLSQLLAAAERPPHLGAIAPGVTASDLYRHWTYEGGAFHLAFAAYWAAFLGLGAALRGGDFELVGKLVAILNDPRAWFGSAAPVDLDPLAKAAPFYVEWLEHAQDDEYWHERSPAGRLDRIEVPALHVSGWYDIFLEGTLSTYDRLCRLGNSSEQLMIIGPWAHLPWGALVGSVDFGRSAGSVIVDDSQVAFFRRHLGAAGEPDRGVPAPVRYFVLFENTWRDAASWPPETARAETWYLRSAGRATTSFGDGWLECEPPPEGEPPDVYGYYPAVPVPAAGGHSAPFPHIHPMGPVDQRAVQQLPEVLVYTSEELRAPLTLAGPVEVLLHVASTATSADFAAKLCVVRADGAVLNIADGIARVSAGLVEPAASSEPLAVRVSLRSTAARVDVGERLRLEVTGGAFPTYDRNPQTGRAPSHAGPLDLEGHSHFVFHRAGSPSSLTVHVLDGSG